MIDRQVEEITRNGIIEPASSPWASNVVLVRKKDGTLRFCVDCRQLNAIKVKDSYPLPLIDNCLNALAGVTWFSTVDLRAGYHNFPIADQDHDKTTFVTRRGCFRYTVMPFGMTTSPSVFQRLMDCVLVGLSYMTCLVYLDDLIVFARTFEEQLARLDEVFGRIARTNIKLKPSKCFLFKREVEFLGHTVAADGVAISPESWTPFGRGPVSECDRSAGLSRDVRILLPVHTRFCGPCGTAVRSVEEKFNVVPVDGQMPTGI